MFARLAFGLVVLSGWLGQLAYSAQCNSFSTSGECNTVSGCYWDSSQGCVCASNVTMDVIFALDASGSIGAIDFQTELNWAEEIIRSSLPRDSRIAVDVFSTSAHIETSFNNWETQDLTKQDVIDIIDDITYIGGQTNTVASLDQCIALFEQQTSPYSSRILIMITDGIPYGNFDTCVCCKAPKLKQLDVTTIIIGVGQFDAAKMDCLVEDPSYIIYLPSYDPNAINTILPILSDVTCPVEYNLKLSEVQLDQEGGTGSQFVELYNSGTAVHLNDLYLTGIFNGPVSGSVGTYLLQGQYLVVYNSDETTPSCEDCACPKSSNLCTDALYLPCCSSGCSCTFTGGSMDNENWYLNATDSTNDMTVDWLKYGSDWPTILTGYTYELEYIGYNNKEGSNWIQSCNTRGTPGYEPIRNCSWTCTDEQCQLNGAADATCTVDNSKCNCNPNQVGTYSDYYFSGTSCYKVPPPGPCYAYWLKNDTNQQRWVRFEWEAAQTDNAVNYSLQYYTDQGGQDIVQTTSRTKNVVDYDYTRDDIDTQAAGNVRTQIGSVRSSSVSCEQITLAPTPQPTDMPSTPPTPMPTGTPTASPTWGPRSCYLSGDICEVDRCDCGENDADYMDDDCTGDQPRKDYAASENRQFITVRRRPSGFPGANCFSWHIRLLDGNYDKEEDEEEGSRRRLLQMDTTMFDMETTLDDGGIGIVPTSGDLCVNGSDEVKISVLIQKREVINGRSRYNLYQLTLTDPDTDMDSSFRLIYPSTLEMVVDITGGESITNTRKEKEMPVWAWILIAAMVLFLGLLAWLVYKYWWKNKRTSADLHETENELDMAYRENEDGWAGDLKQGDVQFNPIATGNPNVQTAPQMQTGLMDGDGTGNQIARADVVVEKFQERQEIAGNMGHRHHG